VASPTVGACRKTLAQKARFERRTGDRELDAAELPAQTRFASRATDEAGGRPRKEEIAAAKADGRRKSRNWLCHADEARGELFAQKTISESGSRSGGFKSQRAGENRRDRRAIMICCSRHATEQIVQVRAHSPSWTRSWREMKIFAPTNLRSGSLSVKAGDVLAPNQQVATLLDESHLGARVRARAVAGHISSATQ